MSLMVTFFVPNSVLFCYRSSRPMKSDLNENIQKQNFLSIGSLRNMLFFCSVMYLMKIATLIFIIIFYYFVSAFTLTVAIPSGKYLCVAYTIQFNMLPVCYCTG